MKASKLRDNLIEHRAMAELSRILVDLKRDCPLPDALDDLKLGAIPPLPLKSFLDEHGFRSLSAKLDLGGPIVAAQQRGENVPVPPVGAQPSHPDPRVPAAEAARQTAQQQRHARRHSSPIPA